MRAFISVLTHGMAIDLMTLLAGKMDHLGKCGKPGTAYNGDTRHYPNLGHRDLTTEVAGLVSSMCVFPSEWLTSRLTKSHFSLLTAMGGGCAASVSPAVAVAM